MTYRDLSDDDRKLADVLLEQPEDEPEKCQSLDGSFTLDEEGRQVCTECGQLLAAGDFGYDPSARLEYLRGEIRAERMSYGDIAELQGLRQYIADDDVELLEAAGVPEIGVIRNTVTGLFWNNDTGWGSLATAAEYRYDEQRHVNLPDEGEWVDVNLAEDTDEREQTVTNFRIVRDGDGRACCTAANDRLRGFGLRMPRPRRRLTLGDGMGQRRGH